MLEINMEVDKGIPFLNLEGILNAKTFEKFGEEINYLLYHQGFHYFVLDFTNIGNVEESIYQSIQSKLAEIFLSCGRVVLCGISNKEKIGFSKEQLYYVNQKQEAFKYLYL
ncbi:MAG: hypothetical protein HFJ12_04235 [Bacilli bacterium]|nr:hypothetical protein [Bacilli bacterium]